MTLVIPLEEMNSRAVSSIFCVKSDATTVPAVFAHGERGMPATRRNIERDVILRRRGEFAEAREIIAARMPLTDDIARRRRRELRLHPILDRRILCSVIARSPPSPTLRRA